MYVCRASLHVISCMNVQVLRSKNLDTISADVWLVPASHRQYTAQQTGVLISKSFTVVGDFYIFQKVSNDRAP